MANPSTEKGTVVVEDFEGNEHFIEVNLAWWESFSKEEQLNMVSNFRRKVAGVLARSSSGPSMHVCQDCLPQELRPKTPTTEGEGEKDEEKDKKADDQNQSKGGKETDVNMMD